MWVYKDGILPGMWSWLTPTSSWMVEVPETEKPNSSQLSALFIDSTAYTLTCILESSSISAFRKKVITDRIESYSNLNSEYLKAILANDSHKIEEYHIKIKDLEQVLFRLWENIPNFSGALSKIIPTLEFSLLQASHEEKLS